MALMVEPGGHSEDESDQDRLLSAIWARLNEAERLATSAGAMNSLNRIAALADDVAVLARALDLVRKTDDQG